MKKAPTNLRLCSEPQKLEFSLHGTFNINKTQKNSVKTIDSTQISDIILPK